MNIRNLNLYKGKNNKLLSALTFEDATFWGSDVFVAVVFALFITQNIDGGSVTHVGIIYGVYRIVRAFLALPIGKFFDRHKGHIDEMWGIVFSSLLTGSIYLVLFSVTQLWAVYVAIVFIAAGHALNQGAWQILFHSSVDESKRGQVTGKYQLFMQIIYGTASICAGIIADVFGFKWIMVLAGVITIAGGVLPLFVREKFEK